MRKYWKVEHTIVLFVIIGIALLLMPFSLTNTRQANFISKWNERYNKADYMFQVIRAHITNDIIKSFENAKDSDERTKLILQLIKPYMRVNTEKSVPRQYRPKYMNKAQPFKGQLYYFDEFYFTENNGIGGIKDIVTSISDNNPDFMLMFDINGLLPPNRWGKDIFGVNIYHDDKIEPLGYGMSMDELKKDCSNTGTGVSCSYYYKIGGGFEE
jgi:hypothetical protein